MAAGSDNTALNLIVGIGVLGGAGYLAYSVFKNKKTDAAPAALPASTVSLPTTTSSSGNRSWNRYGFTKEQILQLQKNLNKLGYSIIEDGIYGDQTAGAVMRWQQKNKHPATGQITVYQYGQLAMQALTSNIFSFSGADELLGAPEIFLNAVGNAPIYTINGVMVSVISNGLRLGKLVSKDNEYYAFVNADNEIYKVPVRNAAVETVISGIDEIGDLGRRGKRKERKKERKEKPKRKGFIRRVGRGIKNVARKVARVAKKGGLALPRAGILLALKMNLFKISERLKWGYLTDAQAQARGFNISELAKIRRQLARLENTFVKMGGKKDAIKKAILSSKKGKLNGLLGIGYSLELSDLAAEINTLPIDGLESSIAELETLAANEPEIGELGVALPAAVVAALPFLKAFAASLSAAVSIKNLVQSRRRKKQEQQQQQQQPEQDEQSQQSEESEEEAVEETVDEGSNSDTATESTVDSGSDNESDLYQSAADNENNEQPDYGESELVSETETETQDIEGLFGFWGKQI
jgi:peptidoglycan hydrolase-like protein with peptidoglycan-binding domain